ncbi:MAG: hypothetical protein L3J07_01120 [Candidatus Magasanikbacteria bacterium]|nr:hypothetical protein [Candidatus Magasanikbacteria bacterium]
MPYRNKKFRILEFVLIGVVMGTVEDLLAVVLATDATFSWRIMWVVLAVSIPFALITELVVDHPGFWKIFFKNGKKKK